MADGLKIGRVSLKNRFILAPMSGVTTLPFRRVCKEHGAALTITELISAEAVCRGNEKTTAMMERAGNEKPFCIQLFGSDPNAIFKAACTLEEARRSEIIDVNLGCSVARILKQGAGAALLKSPEKIEEIFSLLRSLKTPVTAKMRLGYSSAENAVKIAGILERNGVSAIAVHGRTAKQGYSSKVDFPGIRRVKQAVSVPVAGNGDVFKPEDAEAMFEKTGCDAVMVGRGAMGNPFIFSQLVEYFAKGEYEVPSKKQRILEFLHLLKYADKQPVQMLRLQAVYFTKWLNRASETRRAVVKARDAGELKQIFENALAHQ